MSSSGKGWVIIGAFMVVIGIVFSIFFSYVTNNKIEVLTEKCEKDGGEAIVEKGGFIVTTSFKFECEK